MGNVRLDGILVGVTDPAKYAGLHHDDLSDEALDRHAFERTRIVSGREVPEIVPRRLAGVVPPTLPAAE